MKRKRFPWTELFMRKKHFLFIYSLYLVGLVRSFNVFSPLDRFSHFSFSSFLFVTVFFISLSGKERKCQNREKEREKRWENYAKGNQGVFLPVQSSDSSLSKNLKVSPYVNSVVSFPSFSSSLPSSLLDSFLMRTMQMWEVIIWILSPWTELFHRTIPLEFCSRTVLNRTRHFYPIFLCHLLLVYFWWVWKLVIQKNSERERGEKRSEREVRISVFERLDKMKTDVGLNSDWI